MWWQAILQIGSVGETSDEICLAVMKGIWWQSRSGTALIQQPISKLNIRLTIDWSEYIDRDARYVVDVPYPFVSRCCLAQNNPSRRLHAYRHRIFGQGMGPSSFCFSMSEYRS